MNSIDIVIPVYNALDFVQDCLRGLDAYYPERRLILVDDCSGDETKSWLSDYASKLGGTTEVIWRERRGWFTRASNTGIRRALENDDAPWIIVMNSDCQMGAGAFEEMLFCWDEAEHQHGKPTGMLGANGPREQTHKRYMLKPEPGYVTGHCLLLKKSLLRWEKLRLPQDSNEVKGFQAHELVHINSDRALSYQWNRLGYLTVESYWAAVGHHGGKSWGYDLGAALGQNPAHLGA